MRKVSFYTILLSMAFTGNSNAEVSWTLGTTGDLQNSEATVVANMECTDGVCNLNKVGDTLITEQLTLNGDAVVKDVKVININGVDGKNLVETTDLKKTLFLTGEFTNDTVGENVDINIYADLFFDGDFTGGERQGVSFENAIVDGNVSMYGDVGYNATGNKHYGFAIYQSTVEGDVNSYGNFDIASSNNRAAGFLLEDSTVNGNVNVKSDIVAEASMHATGIFFSTLDLAGDIDIKSNMDLTSTANNANGIHLNNNSVIDGDVNVVADVKMKSELTGAGFYPANTTFNGDVNLHMNMDIFSENKYAYPLMLQTSTFNGDFYFDGTVNYEARNSAVMGLYIYNSNFTNFTLAGDFNGNGVNAYAYYFRRGSATGDVNILGDADITARGDYSFGVIAESFTFDKGINLSGNIKLNSVKTEPTGYIYGIYLYSNAKVLDDLNISGDIIIEDASDTLTRGMFVQSGSFIDGDINLTGEISAEKGIVFDDTAYLTGKFNNNGIVTASKSSAIEYYGSDNVFDYSGNGKLSSATYDIDMGEGDDVLNMTNVHADMPSTLSAETVNISASDLDLYLTMDNKDTSLMNLDGTTTLTMRDTNMDTTAEYSAITSFEKGDNLVISTADASGSDLSSLTFDIENYNIDGTLQLVGNELVFTFDETPFFESTEAISPVQAVQVDVATAVSGAASSLSSAVSNSSVTMGIVQDRQVAQKKKEFYEENQFAMAFHVTSDVASMIDFDDEKDSGVWLQIMSQSDNYDGALNAAKNNITSAGYDSSSTGVTVGYDTKIDEDILAGFALSYASGDVDGNNNSFVTDMTSVQLALYGTYKMEDDSFLDGILSYGFGSYDQKRNTGTDIASADYDSDQLSLQLNYGTIYQDGDNMFWMPFVKSTYITVNQDSYDEKGSANNLHVESVNMESFQLGAGVEFSYLFETEQGEQLIPHINLEYANEMGDNALPIDTTILSTGLAGTSFTSPDMGRNILRTGLGMSYINKEGHQMSFDFEKEIRENFDSNSIYIKGKYMF
ncbi:MAG: autotransporter outer membrane beta-barrel domain-containing protein [Alphaproteobacteria bacterium]|jgi:outer membrane autotransporter protein|nr:autotransporter outer membrane beta-barrel domain-containing protein [Alphaproteobacteria bacterium]